MGKQWKQRHILFPRASKSLQMMTIVMKLKDICFLKEKLWPNLDSVLKTRDITLPTKICIVKGMFLFCFALFCFCPVVIYGLIVGQYNKEGWVPKNWLFETVVLEENLESPLDSKEIKPVDPNRNQSWIFTEGLLPKVKLQHWGRNY